MTILFGFLSHATGNVGVGECFVAILDASVKLTILSVKFLQALDELGLRQNTIVIYCSDHGDFAGENGIIEKALWIAYDAITKLPFIWSWVRTIPQGKVCTHL